MKKDEDKIAERLTDKTLVDLAKHISNEYFDLTQQDRSSAPVIAETLVEKIRASWRLILEKSDGEEERLKQITTGDDLLPLVERLEKTNRLSDEALIYLQHGVILDNATRNPGDEIIEQLTKGKLRNLAEYVSTRYSELEQEYSSDITITKILVNEIRKPLLCAGVLDSRAIMNDDLSPIIKELRKVGMLLEALEQDVFLNDATKKPKDVSPDAPGL